MIASVIICHPVSAQFSFTVPESNIINRTVFTSSGIIAGSTDGVALLNSITMRANPANTSFISTVGGTTSIPLGLASLRISKIGNSVNLGGASTIILSNAYQSIYDFLLNLLTGAVLMDLNLSTASHSWIAGNYQTQVQFERLSPAAQNFRITVPSFITPQASVTSTTILVNNLSFFRGVNGITGSKTISVASTVPYVPSIKGSSANFGFSTTSVHNVVAAPGVNLLNTTITGVSTATPKNLSSLSQPLTTTAGIAVAATNNETLTYNFTLSGANLRSGFAQAGTYTIPVLTFAWDKLNSAYPTGGLSLQRTSSLEVVVSELSEIVANQSTVNLNLNTPASYQNGISKDMAAHIRVSKTTPYNVYVRSTSVQFSNGVNQIPLNILRIGPMAGETDMNTVTLSPTAQLLINSANPVIDRDINMRYSIPASETSKLLGKPSGSYTANIIFSFVAP
jgi:hypothetical protein